MVLCWSLSTAAGLFPYNDKIWQNMQMCPRCVECPGGDPARAEGGQSQSVIHTLGHVISTQFPNLSIKLRVCVLWCGGVAGEVLLSRCAAVAVDHHCSQLTQGQTAPSPLKAESCAPATVTPRLLQFYIDTVMKIWIFEGSLLKTHLYKLSPSSNGNAFPHTFLPACSKDIISITCSVKEVVSRLSCVDFHENWGTLVTAQLPPGTILHFQSHLHITAPHQMLMQKLIYSVKHVDTNITECMSNSLWDSGAREEKKKKKMKAAASASVEVDIYIIHL